MSKVHISEIKGESVRSQNLSDDKVYSWKTKVIKKDVNMQPVFA